MNTPSPRTPAPKAADKELMVAYLQALQRCAHDPHISLETLIFTVDLFVLACLDPAQHRQVCADELASFEREKAAALAAFGRPQDAAKEAK